MTSAHFTCTAPKAIDLDIVTTPARAIKVTAEPSTDLTASAKVLADGTANLGSFISEDHGTYSIKLDAKMLKGQAGSAVLTDDEPGDDPAVDTYACTVADAK